jgi:hypothetical protein
MEYPHSPPRSNVALAPTLAVIASSDAPLLLLDTNLSVRSTQPLRQAASLVSLGLDSAPFGWVRYNGRRRC